MKQSATGPMCQPVSPRSVLRRRTVLGWMGAVGASRLLFAQTSRVADGPIEVTIDPRRELGEIHPYTYGQFIEHLERCVYGGLFDPKSPQADEAGLRGDVIAALREMGGVKVARWPGGNFASYYHWRDGIGPREARPRRYDVTWSQEESNAFGTDEYLSLCRKLECDPFIAVNMGTGDLREACEWVEYCRRSDRKPPVQIWGLGNEHFGPWEVGFYTADEYGRMAQQFAQFMRSVEKDLQFVGVGHLDPAWNERVLHHCGQQLHWLSIHLYAHRGHLEGKDDFDATVATPAVFEQEIKSMSDQLAEYERKAGREQPIRICLEEWNSRHLRQGQVLRSSPRDIVDALFVAGVYNVCHRLAGRVSMSNYTFPVNCNAPLMADERGVLRTATFDVHRLYATKMRPIAIDAQWTSERFSAQVPSVAFQCPPRNVTAQRLDISATRSKDGGQMSVAMLNRYADQTIEVALRINGQSPPRQITLHTLTSRDVRDVNTWEQPNRVRSQTHTLADTKGIVQLPPHSVNIAELA